MKTPRFGKLRTGRKAFKPSFAQTLRDNNAATLNLEKQFGDLREAKGMPMPELAEVSEYRPRMARGPDGGYGSLGSSPKPKGELSELQEQIRVVTWWDRDECHLHRLPPFALLSIPNGSALTGPIAGHNLKRSGMRAGAEDLLLTVARQGFHGLFVEIKALDGTVDMEQHAMHNFHKHQAYLVRVAFGHEEAKKIIREYLQ